MKLMNLLQKRLAKAKAKARMGQMKNPDISNKVTALRIKIQLSKMKMNKKQKNREKNDFMYKSLKNLKVQNDLKSPLRALNKEL